MYQVLPFLEHQDLWGHFTPTSGNGYGDDDITGYPVPLYFCPSVAHIRIYSYSQVGDTTTTTRAMNDYCGNGGTWAAYRGSIDYTSPACPLDGPIVPSTSLSHKKVRIGDIKDGTATTMLAGEKYLYRGSFIPGGDPALGRVPYNDDQGYCDGWDNDTIGFGMGWSNEGPVPPQHFDFNKPTLDGPCNCVEGWGFAFGSIHAACNVVFCDGSAHSVAFTIDPQNWLALCSANDGKAVSPNGWQ
jgi:hypothetical protein